jgi:hypothetical protein
MKLDSIIIEGSKLYDFVASHATFLALVSISKSLVKKFHGYWMQQTKNSKIRTVFFSTLLKKNGNVF